jgi:hypothetical protein
MTNSFVDRAPWVPPVTESAEGPWTVEPETNAAAQAAELAFKRGAIERLRRRAPADAIKLLDGLERFFDNGEFWIQKNDGLHGNRCLVGGIEEARRAYNLTNSRPAHDYLGRAIAPHAGVGHAFQLAQWNAECEDFSKLRTVIEKARDMARADEERLRAAEAEMPEARPVSRPWWRFWAGQ